MPLATVIPDAPRNSRGEAVTPSIPRTWTTGASSPFTSRAERQKLQGLGVGNAVAASKTAVGGFASTFWFGPAEHFGRA
eukprot:15443717-Alexandrium_andersonii.AAC.1